MPAPRSTRSQLARFVAVGAAGAAAYLGVYAALRFRISAQPASLLARVLVALVTTWLNARITFAARSSWPRVLAGAAALLVVGAVSSAAVLAGEQTLFGSDRGAEVVALVAAQVLVAALRFVVLQRLLATADPAAQAGTVVLPAGTGG